MTGKERCWAAFKGESLDRPPVYAFISNTALVEYLMGETLCVENSERLLAKTYLTCTDTTRQFLDDIFAIYKEGEEVTNNYGYLFRRSRFTQWIERRPWSNIEGMVCVIKQQIHDMSSWKPPEDDTLKKRYQYLDNLVGAQVMLMGQAWVGTAPGSYFRDGLENWSYFKADYPSLAQSWVKARHQMNLKKIRAYANPERCPFEHMDADIAGKNGLLISPAFLRESGWYDRVSELVDAYHQMGVRIIFHSDGDIRQILPDLIATGIDGLNPIDTSADMTLAEVRKIVGHKILLVGGIDNRVLTHDTMDEVRRYVREQVDLMDGTAWWAASSTEELDDSMPLDNILAMLETVAIM